MSKLKTTSLCLAALLLGLPASAPAQDGRLLNLSANGVISESNEIAFITCTILRGRLTIAVFAEARASNLDLDPAIELRRAPFEADDVIASIDDFGALDAATQNEIIAAVGRSPGQSTDSALLLSKNSQGDDSICVIAFDVIEGSDGGLVNVQIQQVFTSAGVTRQKAADYTVTAAGRQDAVAPDPAAVDGLLGR